MRQLVGLQCALCGRSIRDIVEGVFCEGCGCPIHRACAAPGSAAAGNCAACGAAAIKVEHHREAAAAAADDRDFELRSHYALHNVISGGTLFVGALFYSFFKSVISLSRNGNVVYLSFGAMTIGAAQLVYGIVHWPRGRRRAAARGREHSR